MYPQRITASVLVLCLLVASTAFLPGCAKTPGGPSGIDDYKPLLRLGVSVAVDRLLTANPEVAPMMIQVTRVLEDVFNKGEFTSVAEVYAFLQARIPWTKISPDTRPLVEAMIAAISEELRVLVTKYQIPESQNLLLMREMMTWVREVAERHQVEPVKVRRVKA
jgi:hypothetical protein